MEQDAYSKREIEHYFKDIHTRLSKQDDMLSRILEQANKTNGRVSKLEWWRDAIVWGFPICMTITFFVLNYLKK